MITPANQSGRKTPFPPHLSKSLRWRIWQILRQPVFRPLIRLVEYLLRFWYALRLEGRSFSGRMKTLLSRKHWRVDLGLVFESLPNGSLVENSRTNARSRGTQKLKSDYPWANTIDLEIFLRGFHEGEQYVLRSLHTQELEQSLAYSRGGNSMPPRSTQQDSKHDLQSPLP